MGKLGTKWHSTERHWSKGPNAEEIWAKIKEKLKNRKPNSGSFKPGQPNKFKGKHLPWIGHNTPHTEETKEKIRNNITRRYGTDNNKWRGDDVGNKALHGWVKRKLGRPMKCEFCGFTTDNPYQIHWANRSHAYKRDVTDWLRLCVPCHKKYDLTFLRDGGTI